MIRLIASDLDGTLLDRDFTFRPRTLEALAAAAETGIDILFVTGRPHRWLDPLRDQLRHDSYAICSNGAVLYHLGTDEVEIAELTEMSAVAEVHELLQERFPRASFTLETLDTVYLQGEYERSPVLAGVPLVEGDLTPVFNREDGVVKYLMRLPGADPERLLDEVREVVGDRLGVTAGVPGVPLIELARSGVNKGTMLQRFATARGITADETAAFGDMPNDLEMLRWAGHAFAMASGSRQLIAEVGRTCPAFDEDGVAQVIEKIVAERR